MGSIIKISNLTDVKPFKSAWTVQVKVLQTWKSFTPKFGSSLEMVLTDENGVKIHASCKKSFLERLERHCRVGEWKVITNFTLSPASGLYRPTSHVYKMSFGSQTSITDSALSCENMFLGLQDFDTILGGSLKTCFLIDVIGEVLDLGGLGIVQCQGKERKKVEFTLRDINDQRLKCCLWGKFAELLTNEVTEPNNGDICLIRFAKLGKYRGELQVSNSFDSSLLLINPEIEEAKAIKQMFHDENNSIELYETKEEKTVVLHKREKWSEFPFRTIQEMKCLDHSGNCRVICSIYAIDTDWGWYYFACVVCNKKVFKMFEPNDDLKVPNWWCEVCARVVTKVSPRYKLHLLVKDQTSESKFMLLDSIAKTIVKVSATKLLNGSLDEIEDPDLLPDEIVDLVGKTYGFGLAVDEHNIAYGVEIFKAMKIWNLEDIVTTDSTIESADLSEKENTMICCSEASCQQLSDVPSNSDSFSTPSSKRSLEHPDLDAADNNSSTKKQCTKAIKIEKTTPDAGKKKSG